MNELSNRTCEICGGSNFTVTGKPVIAERIQKFIRHDYKIVRCDSCRFYFVNPPIDFTQQEWVETYTDEYFPEINAHHRAKRRKQLEQRLNTIGRLTGNKSIRFLDIGCGEGNALAGSLNRGWDTYGLDIIDHRMGEAKSGSVTFVQANLEEAGFEDNFFDAVYLDSVLEHTTEPVKLLRNIRRIITPGGIIYIGVPNEDAFLNLARRLLMILRGEKWRAVQLNPFVGPYHVVGFTRNSLRKILEDNDFQIEKFRDFDDFTVAFNFSMKSFNFYQHLVLLPLMLTAIPFGQEYYFESYARKS